MVAAIVLGLFGLGQILAVAIYFLPEWRKGSALIGGTGQRGEVKMEEGAASRDAVKAEEGPVAAASGDGRKPPVAPNPALTAKALPLVSEADRLYRIGEFDGALGLLRQAESMLPMNPQIQFRLGLVFEELGQNAEAYLAYEKSLHFEGLNAEARRQAEQKLMLLSQVVGAGQGALQMGGEVGLFAGAGGVSVREPSGLQPGAVLGIIDSRMIQGQDGSRRVRLAVKSREGVDVNSQAAEVKMTFYVKDEFGDFRSVSEEPARRWISEPVDWRGGEPEVVDFDFRGQGSRGGDVESDVAEEVFGGYVAAVYYEGELQDVYSEPPDLQGKFPPALSLIE